MTAFLVSFGVLFVAKFGDTSQLMALAFATCYRIVPVLIGITAATALVHAVSSVPWVGELQSRSSSTRRMTRRSWNLVAAS